MPFPLLADAGSYNPNTFNYVSGTPPRAAWIDAFRRTTPEFTSRAAGDASVPDAAAAAARFAQRFQSELEVLESPASDTPEPLSCLKLCALRDRLLREEGFADCFAAVKAAENTSALEHLPRLLAELDGLEAGEPRLRALIEGVFAGNIFDLGAAHTSALFASGGLDFHDTRAKLQPRPWAVDCFDALALRWAGPPHAQAVLFCDNSGSDFVLGMLPLARALLQRGTPVILAVNSVPSINDVTYAEMLAFLPRAAAVDAFLAACLADGRLCLIASGSDLPVIDLRLLSPELCAAAASCDLVVLEGMGRGIESNLYAAFKTEVLCLGMVKHHEVGEALGGKPLFSCVCRYDRGVFGQ